MRDIVEGKTEKVEAAAGGGKMKSRGWDHKKGKEPTEYMTKVKRTAEKSYTRAPV